MNFNEFKLEYEKKRVEQYTTSVEGNPLISVGIVTFQHKDFIRDCIDGVLAQQTDFPIELLVGEDGSTDGTRQICLDYAQKHPTKVRLFLHHRENNISIGGSPTGRFNFIYNLFSARGKYIALCEGDDYWIHSQKLQKQVDFLESNPDYGWCIHNAYYQLNHGELEGSFVKEHLGDTFNIEDVLELGGGFYPTASIIFRRELMDDIPGFMLNVKSGDVGLIALVSNGCKGKYFNDKMSVYRKHEDGVFSNNSKNHLFRINAIKSRIDFLKEFNKHSNYNYTNTIRKTMKKLRFEIIKRYFLYIKEKIKL